MTPATWICSQLGAREHYAIPRALHAMGRLNRLLTDSWVAPGESVGGMVRGLRDRYHPDLATADVTAWNTGLIAFELGARVKSLTDWSLIVARNSWFQGRVTSALPGLSGSQLRVAQSNGQILFSYSYTALEPFRRAKALGWLTVLGQIDPGPREESIVRRLHEANPEFITRWHPAPVGYWQRWRDECDLADRILVNSTWAREALLQENVSEDKLHVVPLAFSHASDQFAARTYPSKFTAERPLRILFLGQVNLRKGVPSIFEALPYLKDRPVEFWFVGPIQVTVPAALSSDPRVKWIGPVSRGEAGNYYRAADVFLFPTHSDGFGLTQLEAQSWKLPIIASRFCGTVVTDGINGLILQEVSGTAIAAAIDHCLEKPHDLDRFSRATKTSGEFSLEHLGESLVALP